MINPKNELFVWGPVDGRPVYCHYFMKIMVKPLLQQYNLTWPETLFFFVRDKMTVIADDALLGEVGRKYFTAWLLDDNNFEKVKNDFRQAVNELHMVQSKAAWKNLSQHTDMEFA